jgi:hypothetical protein
VYLHSNEQKAQFLLYVTGFSQMPVGGLRNLATRAPLKISSGPSPDHLPISHTGCHQLELLQYADEAALRKKLIMAESKQIAQTISFSLPSVNIIGRSEIA